jgi:chaperonin cofactor prefoldin
MDRDLLYHGLMKTSTADNLFTRPHEPVIEIGVSSSLKILNPSSSPTPKSANYKATAPSIKSLTGGNMEKWRPKSLEFSGLGKQKQHEESKSSAQKSWHALARSQYETAASETKKAKAEYERLDASAKAFRAMGDPRAKAYEQKAAIAKNIYAQKLDQLHIREKTLAKLAGPLTPAQGLNPGGEELCGPTGSTKAKAFLL